VRKTVLCREKKEIPWEIHLGEVEKREYLILLTDCTPYWRTSTKIFKGKDIKIKETIFSVTVHLPWTMVSPKLSERLKWLCDVTSSFCFSYSGSLLKIFCRSAKEIKPKQISCYSKYKFHWAYSWKNLLILSRH
jgi:hypothetical protein